MNCPELEKEVTSEVCTKMKKNEWCNQECEAENIVSSEFIQAAANVPPAHEELALEPALPQKQRKNYGYKGLCLIKGTIISTLSCSTGRAYAKRHPKGTSQCIGCDYKKNFVRDGKPSQITKKKIALIEEKAPIVSNAMIVTVCFNNYPSIFEALKNRAEEEIRTLQEQILYELKKTFSQEKGSEKK